MQLEPAALPSALRAFSKAVTLKGMHLQICPSGLATFYPQLGALGSAGHCFRLSLSHNRYASACTFIVAPTSVELHLRGRSREEEGTPTG